MAHLHITAWALAFILLFVVFGMYRAKKNPVALHMILRVDYLLILFSGVMLFMQYSEYSGELFVKVIAGLIAIASMEMITVKASNGAKTSTFWIVFAIAAIIAIVLGFFRLPYGVLP